MLNKISHFFQLALKRLQKAGPLITSVLLPGMGLGLFLLLVFAVVSFYANLFIKE